MDKLIEEALEGYDMAVKAGVRASETGPRAVAARYEKASRRVIVDLSNGCAFVFPVDMAQGIAGAEDESLAEIEVWPGGEGLHWERLDADLGVPQLLAGIMGSRAWMKELARRGGQSRSEAKSAAARENGKKGGRPRKAA